MDMKLSRNFTLEEAVQSSTAKSKGIDNTPPDTVIAVMAMVAVECVQLLRDEIQKPLRVSSWYRCEELNIAVGSLPDKDGTPQSQHRRGEAVDFSVDDMTPEQVIGRLLKSKIDFDQAIAEHDYDKGDSWTHLSYTKRRPNRKEVKRIVIEKGIKRTLPYTSNEEN